ncbi:EamA family transporter [Bacteriovorax sp. PP10]|uniref:EamA family transporter n=1 Tax=Bacteriovorax antarcticus TaxID=3088717 RepID=A0ABU5VYQ4_9BACT|nr:EamA family transporter [Bacteriovorax sp. PP10]MEA9358189.1 EamA family transporter [Bacteriovorax sp. PP10]
MNSRNMFLFSICSLIWGTTWFAIKFQVDSTTAVVGVFYRFLIAAIIMFLINVIFIKKNLKFPWENHKFFILQGLFNFCLNYILTYISEKSISSGLVAVTFSTLIYFNMFGMRIFYKKEITRNIIYGATLGFLGMICLFWKEIANFNADQATIFGIIIGIVATFFASIGNMFAYRNHQLKIPVMTFNAYGMLYGALFSLILGLFMGESFAFPTTPSFLFSLGYLSIFGTVIAFYAYQTLVGTIGADRAAYTSIINPVIAMLISSMFENITFTPQLFLGIVLCFAGNLIALRKTNQRPSPA